ncbi:BZ3500_MvSof-1268-A1-R1_Chr9g10758 [Microbotryum saponariae]|uniref:BZ3500_MvSof-1268-A1-R1_Chr9g10758 protein n=1 Tax=Microbotryum saponariae TaxID=289078 RepID=A0A2X0KH90_9BASI|nr:BZ3501_MvSof-1269-A2-R1_Chr9g10506 [Microbotryum saponariae]SDA00638.1 BZ3500_MvSof-1268-A1-R1_Chr9g10758 [Microbotryum saponariae]
MVSLLASLRAARWWRPRLLLCTFATSTAILVVNALSALDRPRSGFLENVLESKDVDQKYCKPSGLIDDACCDFETVESVNDDLYSSLHDIVSTPYFRYHKVDLYRECPFWQEDGSCMNRACGVETTDEPNIPEKWKPSKLGALRLNASSPVRRIPSSSDMSPIVPLTVSDPRSLGFRSTHRPRSKEVPSSRNPISAFSRMNSMQVCVYVDLLDNPERFTGYAGPSSSRVWKAIYEENCFTPVTFIDPSRPESEGGSGFASLSSTSLQGGAMMGLPSLSMGSTDGGGWGENEKKFFGSLAGPRDGGDETCLEKRVFYRVISGLHASISIHICDDYLDKSTGQWAPNLQCFVTRIAQHPERLQNVYFTYVLLLRALSKSGPFLLDTLKNTEAEPATIGRMKGLIKSATGCPTTFDEGSMFTGVEAEVLKSEFKSHFRNVSRIMDCVGCDKCRLWGKLQITGLGTALKLLFSAQEQTPTTTTTNQVDLSRSEVVAFVNTLHRLSESLAAVEKFRGLWNERSFEERERVEKRAEEGKQEEEKGVKAMGRGVRRGKGQVKEGKEDVRIEKELEEREEVEPVSEKEETTRSAGKSEL